MRHLRLVRMVVYSRMQCAAAVVEAGFVDRFSVQRMSSYESRQSSYLVKKELFHGSTTFFLILGLHYYNKLEVKMHDARISIQMLQCENT